MIFIKNNNEVLEDGVYFNGLKLNKIEEVKEYNKELISNNKVIYKRIEKLKNTLKDQNNIVLIQHSTPKERKQFLLQEIKEAEQELFLPQEVLIDYLVGLTNDEYDLFIKDFMEEVEWLNEKMGGAVILDKVKENTEASAIINSGKSLWNLTKEDRDKIMPYIRTAVVKVVSPNRQTLYINNEGFNHARYIGLKEGEHI